MKQNGNNGRILPMFMYIFAWFSVAWAILLMIAITITLRYSLDTFRSDMETNLSSIAQIMASNSEIIEAFEKGYCDQELISYIDGIITENKNIDIITLADVSSNRLYHIRHEFIGEKFVGGDEAQAILGKSYISEAVGTQGAQIRAFCPIKNKQGVVLGFSMASTKIININSIKRSIIQSYIGFAIALTIVSISLSALASLYINEQLLGFTPNGLAYNYLMQNEVINDIDEGLISLDSEKRIRLVNKSAEKMLGERSDILIGKDIDAIICTDKGESLAYSIGSNIATDRANILASAVKQSRRDGKSHPTIILKDKTETIRQAEQLNGSKHVITALRARTHDFMNKMQVISGFIQMDRYKDADAYIESLSDVYSKSVTPILQRIQNFSVAALLLGKLDNMNESDVSLSILPNSILPPHSSFLSTDELITIIGNLLENAMEAINIKKDDFIRKIELQIVEDEKGLMIEVSDTGCGIAEENIDRITNWGFSTKAINGRGVGMSLVHRIIEKHQGSIEIDSEEHIGTIFTLFFTKHREGR